jgi:hypothetical protein
MQIGFMSRAPILHRYKIGGLKIEVYESRKPARARTYYGRRGLYYELWRQQTGGAIARTAI